MNKRYQTPTRTDAWRFVDEARTFVFQISEGRVNILNLDCNVMHSRPALREKLSHRSFRAQRLEQLDVSVADCQHANFDALLGDYLCRINLEAEGIPPDCQAFFDAFCGYSDVINFQQPE
jgi:hypothetical protein